MKKMLIPILAGALLITGCVGPYYKSRAQYDQGEWKGWADNRDVRRLNQDQVATESERLALEKLRATPVQTLVTNGVNQGYLGVIANMSTHRRLTFKFSGPETGVEYLGPGQQIEKYLLPGNYTGEIFSGGQKVGWTAFRSEPVEKGFLGKRVHWLFYSEW